MKIRKLLRFFLLLPTLVFAFCISTVQAQVRVQRTRDVASKKIIGKYNLVVTYKFSFYYAFDFDIHHLPDSKDYDMNLLEIGDNFSRYYSEFADRIDTNDYKNIINHMPDADPSAFMDDDWNKQERYEDVYLNYPTSGSLLCRTMIINTEYEYTEPINKFSWNFGDSTCNILGYDCKLATTSFRGRNYKVYYTEEIPLNYGPWKFYGLPGLILKVTEEKGMFDWIATNIRQCSGDIHIYDPSVGKTPGVPEMRVKKVGRKQVLKMEKMIWTDNIALEVMHGLTPPKYYEYGPTNERRPLTKDNWKDLNSPLIPQLETE